jgi:plastocyanin
MIGFLATLTVGVGAASAATITGKVVHPKGTRDLIVYVANATGSFTPKKIAKYDQRNMKFIPHVLPILAGTTVEFQNNDTFDHNVFSPDGDPYDLGTFPGGEARKQKFDKAGIYAQLCKLHPEMEGYIVVLSNPYFAKTKRDGSFVVKGVPSGKYELKVWGKKLKNGQKERTFAVDASNGKTQVTIDFTAGE